MAGYAHHPYLTEVLDTLTKSSATAANNNSNNSSFSSSGLSSHVSSTLREVRGGHSDLPGTELPWDEYEDRDEVVQELEKVVEKVNQEEGQYWHKKEAEEREQEEVDSFFSSSSASTSIPASAILLQGGTLSSSTHSRARVSANGTFVEREESDRLYTTPGAAVLSSHETSSAQRKPIPRDPKPKQPNAAPRTCSLGWW